MIVSYSNPTRFCILHDVDFSGDLSYLFSRNDLNITTREGFDASALTKIDVSIVADDLFYNDFILTDSLASGTLYYFYILNKASGEVSTFVKSTGKNLGSEVVTGTSGDLTYTINFPYGYDSAGTTIWPLLVSLKGPNLTSGNNDFPCVTFNANIDGGDSYSSRLASIRTMIATVVDTYHVDKSRIYGIGYSAGGCAIVEIANSDGRDDYQFKAIAVTGISTYLVPSKCGNLGNVHTMLFYGDIDTVTNPGTLNVHDKVVSTNGTGEHVLVKMPGLDHNTSYNPPWASPYTFRWLLGK